MPPLTSPPRPVRDRSPLTRAADTPARFEPSGRARQGSLKGRTYWRSLDELADSPEFRAHLEREFPNLAPHLTPATRRTFLKLMGASLALAGATACRWPAELIVPYARRPPGRTPGVSVSYATAFELGGVGTGVLATSFDGRPIKIEGNELHPFSRGATDALAQASVLELYDPDRSTRVVQRVATDGRMIEMNRSWEEFAAWAGQHFGTLKSRAGAGLRVLSGATSSPTFADVRARFLKVFPQAKWFEYEPLSRDNERIGTAMAFGKPHRPQLRFDQAERVVCFDCDFLLTHPASVRYMRDFASRRARVDHDQTLNRLYVIESTYSLTGANADERYAVRSSDIPALLCHLAAELGRQGVTIPPAIASFEAPPGAAPPRYLAEMAVDLAAHQGRSIIAVGPRQSPDAHAVAALLNEALGNVGKTVHYTAEPDPQRPTHLDAIGALAVDLHDATPRTLIILGGNPAYDAPADLAFDALLARHTVVHLSLYRNETSQHCTWHLPAAHYLEAWGDCCAWDGTLSLVQPLIDPLYNGRAPIELLTLLAGDELTRGYELVRRTFKAQFTGGGDFEAAWRRGLHDGLVPDTAWPLQTPSTNADWAAIASRIKGTVSPPARASLGGGAPNADTYEIVFAQDHKLYDGRFANNGWLQELPDPITKLTWDNAALISTADAARLRVRQDDKIEITVGDRRLSLPVYVLPGHAPGSLTLPLGYGRPHAGIVAQGSGFDVYKLRTAARWHVATGAKVRRAGGTYRLSTTQDHHTIDSDVGREETKVRVPELLREGTLEEFKRDPKFAAKRAHALPLIQLFGDHEFRDKPKWAMTVDLNRCTGCSACVLACQAENNIPVVGKEEVLRGREMHWMRIDRYFSGDPRQADDVHISQQPMLCQQCENAPCEQVCPVGATLHDQEGLNVMVYNRCIGTRYCSNNCPWKVRRFNWFYNHYGPKHPRSKATGTPPYPGTLPQTEITPIEMMVHNPNVTVRTRGVMEKCTYCIQRIEAAKIKARNDGRPVRDGEIVTACQQVCPAEALLFGDLNDAGSRIARLYPNERSYFMLETLNARPRTRYLARIRNPLHDAGGTQEQGHAPQHVGGGAEPGRTG